jgi:hypothetical protein
MTIIRQLLALLVFVDPIIVITVVILLPGDYGDFVVHSTG